MSFILVRVSSGAIQKGINFPLGLGPIVKIVAGGKSSFFRLVVGRNGNHFPTLFRRYIQIARCSTFGFGFLFDCLARSGFLLGNGFRCACLFLGITFRGTTLFGGNFLYGLVRRCLF